MSRKKEKESRKELLSLPWWKVKGKWYAVGVLVFILAILGLYAVGGNFGSGAAKGISY
jgi:hypothetical protein